MSLATRPRRRTGTRTHYTEDSDSGEASRPSLRSPGTRPNYIVDASSESEDSSSDESDVDVLEPSSSIRLPPRRMPTRSNVPRPSKRKAPTSRSKPFASYKRRKAVGAPLKLNHAPAINNAPFVRPGQKIPAWQTLEHSILAEIFKRASYPLCTNYLRPNSSVQWLIGLSGLSK